MGNVETCPWEIQIRPVNLGIMKRTTRHPLYLACTWVCQQSTSTAFIQNNQKYCPRSTKPHRLWMFIHWDGRKQNMTEVQEANYTSASSVLTCNYLRKLQSQKYPAKRMILTFVNLSFTLRSVLACFRISCAFRHKILLLFCIYMWHSCIFTL